MAAIIHMTFYRVPVPKQGDRVRIVHGHGGKSFGHHYQPAKVKNEHAALALLAEEYRPDVLWTEPISAQVSFFTPWTNNIPKNLRLKWQASGLDYKATRPDLDNLEKMIWDALEGVIYKNDSQICSKFVEKRYGVTPRIEIILTKIER